MHKDANDRHKGGSSGSYRILIADDEPDIREGLAMTIRRFGWLDIVATARDGQEAVDLCNQLVPDIVLTDINMPHLNGLDFLEQVHAFLPDTVLIVISGYDEFEYAKQAVQLGVMEYLLKPIAVEDLKHTLEKAAQKIDSTRQHALDMTMIHQMMPHAGAWQRLLSDCTDESALAALPDTAQWNGFCCAFCRGTDNAEMLRELLQQALTEKTSLLAIRAVASGICACLLAGNSDSSSLFLELNERLLIAANHGTAEGAPLEFFLGRIVEKPENIAVSYKTARDTMEYCIAQGSPAVTSYQDIWENTNEQCNYPEQLCQALCTAVTAASENDTKRITHSLMQWFTDNQVNNAQYIRGCVLSICFRVLGTAQSYDMLSYYEFSDLQREIMSASSRDELEECLQSLVGLLKLRREQKKHNDSISSIVLQRMREHLQDESYSLNNVAAELFISPNYLRQLFKRETGKTFVETMTQLRMERAAALLEQEHIRINEVAEHCGYSDARYFSICFKKQYHMTPSEYQASFSH